MGFGLRLSYLIYLLPTCSDDESIFGLMTKHLLEGKEFPIYFYGAHYGGALLCYLAAIPFSLFGPSMSLLKLTTYLFSIPTIIFVYLLARSLSDKRVAILSALFMALPPFLINWTGQLAAGGYPETLFFGTLSLLLTHSLIFTERTPRQEIRSLALLGFLNGIGTWILFSMIPYTLTTWTFLAFKKMKTPLEKLLVIFLIFYAFGIFPLVIYNIRYPFATFTRLGARVTGIGTSEISGKGTGDLVSLAFSTALAMMENVPKAIFQVVRNTLEMMRIDSSLGRIAGVWNILLAFVLVFLFLTVAFSQRKNFLKNPLSLLSVFVIWMTLFLALTGLTLPRYVSFMYPALAILLAWAILRFISRPWVWISLVALFLSANLINHFVVLRTPPTEDRWRELIQFLERKGLRYGYTDSLTAYQIVFLTDEKTILSPVAGPKNTDRYPAYTRAVDQAKEVFFIFEKDSEASERFEASLAARRVSFKKETVKRKAVYYDFSSRIFPGELPLIRLFRPGEPWIFGTANPLNEGKR